MAPAFNWKNNVHGAAAATSVSVTRGGNTITDGDFLIATVALAVATNADPGAITAPSGWTQFANDFTFNAAWPFGMRRAIFYKITSGGESGPYTFSWTTSTISTWALIDYQGASATPIDISGATANHVYNSGGFTGETMNNPSVGATGLADLLIGIWCWGDTSGTATAPTGMNSRLVDTQPNATEVSILISDQQLASSGATPQHAMTPPNTVTVYISNTLTIFPISAAVGVPSAIRSGLSTPGQGPSRGLRAVQAFPASGVVDTPLTAAFGSFTETGETATFDMKVPGAFGSFTFTGEAATVGPGIVGAFGSFVETGEAATFDMDMPGAFGSLALTGEAAIFGTGISGAFGSFTETGEPALFDTDMPGAFGGYVLTGEPATLTASGGVTVNFAFGSFTFTGSDATLTATSTQQSVGSSISGGYFSRKRWHALIGEIEAERAQAKSVKNAGHRKAVARAAALADKALKAAREAEDSAQVAADLRAMTDALQAAAGAKSLGNAIAQANEAVEFARSAMAAMIAYQEFEDDEEEAIALLLMH